MNTLRPRPTKKEFSVTVNSSSNSADSRERGGRGGIGGGAIFERETLNTKTERKQ